jgi:hypothetical protein
MVNDLIPTQLDSPGMDSSYAAWTGWFFETAQSSVVVLLKASFISSWDSTQVEWSDKIGHAPIKVDRSNGAEIAVAPSNLSIPV